MGEAGQVAKVGNSFNTLAGVLVCKSKSRLMSELFRCHYMQSQHQGGGV